MPNSPIEQLPVPPAIQISNVNFSYGKIPVLDDVSLTIDDPSTVCVVGPNGGGKTTLVKIILGLIKPDTGRVEVFGRSPDQMRSVIGYTPQYQQFDPQFPITVREVVLMGRIGLDCRSTSPAADREAADRAMGEVMISDLANRSYSALSGGQRQRVLIARALVSEPRLLLLDEPTANVDASNEKQLSDILRRLKGRMTIVLVSHDLGFVSDQIERVVCVNRQVVVHPTSDLTGQAICDLYAIDLRLIRHDHVCAEHGHEVGAPSN